MGKSVTIIGCATGWENAPTDGESWGITNIALRRKVSASFDMHDLTWTVQQWYDHYTLWIDGHFGRNYMLAKAQKRVEQMPAVFNRINALGIPFYTTRTYDSVPTSVAYPIAEIEKAFQTRYFASTFDYAIAKAIFDGFEAIELYGVKMNANEEYAHQAKSAHYWIGRAEAAGIKTVVHEPTTLLKTKNNLLYGYNVRM